MRFMMMIPRVYPPDAPPGARAGEGFTPPAEDAVNFCISIFKDSKIVSDARYGEAGAEVSGRPKGTGIGQDRPDGWNFPMRTAETKKPLFTAVISVLLMSILSTVPVAALEGAPHVKNGYAPVNGLKMYYEIHGTSNGKTPPLVLLHGGGSTIHTSFGTVLQLFAKTRQVIAFEQQGHGHTADIGRPYSFELSADDAAALLRYLRIERADFFGYSNGGNIALQVAIRHPALTRKLIVASAMFKRDGLYPEFWESMRHATLENMPAELREAYTRVSPHPEQLQLFHDKSVKRMLEFKDWRPEDIKKIGAPTMVMVADGDIVRPEHAVEMFRLLPHAQLAVLPGTDHMTLVNRAEWQVSMIEAFLDAPVPKQKHPEAR